MPAPFRLPLSDVTSRVAQQVAPPSVADAEHLFKRTDLAALLGHAEAKVKGRVNYVQDTSSPHLFVARGVAATNDLWGGKSNRKFYIRLNVHTHNATELQPRPNKEFFVKAKQLTPDLSLGFLGEDSGGPVAVSFRRGPVNEFSEDNVLKALGFKNLVKTKRFSGYSFSHVRKDDSNLWADMESVSLGRAAVKSLKKLLSDETVVNLATVVTDDSARRPFAANGYLVAQLVDGGLLVLRGDLGGQGF